MKTAIHQMMIDARMGSNSNDLCKQCRAASNHVTNALGPYLVCDAEFSAKSILFVGKVARGDCLGPEIADQLEDVTAFGASSIAERSWPYYAYTRAIIERVYGDLATGIRHVSFTNMVKCNNETTPDTSDRTSKEFCIAKNRFIWEEIEVIRPRLVIFYTGTAYDDFIDGYMPVYASTRQNNENRRVVVGKKTMPWWSRSFYDDQQREVLKFLRVGHPERKKKEDYVDAVSRWIRCVFEANPRDSK